MSLSSGLKILEDLTSNAKQIQDDVIKEILKLNAKTEYLQRFLHESSDKELFKKKVPVVSYEDVKPYIERVVDGDSSDIISGKPITEFILSSGTSGGKLKIFPINNNYFEKMKLFNALYLLIISKHIDGVEQGKTMCFIFTKSQSKTPSGLLATTASSSFFLSDCFKNRPSKYGFQYTSPDEVILCLDNKQSMYCHLLCGLVQRNEVVRIGAMFASILVRAITFLENHWRELCSNIRSGYLSEWITDLSCKDSVSNLLEGPNPELADLIEQECSRGSWEGIITRLWPKTKLIECVVTGQMAQYIPTLEFYSNKLPMVSLAYGSSESPFGINLDPLCKPQDVSYTFIPNISYFEFLPVGEANMNEIVDLVDVKLGCNYEPVVTNYFGLHRYKMGDVLQVTGFHNSTPQFKFISRKNMVLSVYIEKTSEEDILKALDLARVVLETSNMMLMGFTSYADMSTVPGHYVLYWELKAKITNDTVELDSKTLVECCCVIEESFNALYRDFRVKDGPIGALEIRVVERGTFASLMDYLVSRGAPTSQYKTPICINSSDALEVLENKVLARFFSNKSPPLKSTDHI